MKLTQAEQQPTQKGATESFTGTAWQQPLATGEMPEPLHVTRVTFEPGARPMWRHHPRGQVLVATVGIGRIQGESTVDEQATWLHPVGEEDYARDSD